MLAVKSRASAGAASSLTPTTRGTTAVAVAWNSRLNEKTTSVPT